MSAEQHARLSPSNHRWPNCPGSVREEAAYPDISGEAAIDGTGSHLLLESCLTHNVRAEAYDGQVIGVNHPDQPMGWLVSMDRIERVQMCLNYIERRVAELKEQFPGSTVAVEAESKSNPGAIVGRDDWHGTCDVTLTVWFEERVLFIETIDYKDGRGWVSENNNSQLQGYLAGKLHCVVSAKSTPCRMTIVQPKTSPPVRYSDTTKEELMIEINRLGEAAARTDDPEAPLVPDSKNGKGYCQWCKHKKNCTALSEQSVGRILPMTENVIGGSLFEIVQKTFGDITAMSTEELTELADARAGLEAIFDKVDTELERRIETGEDVDGYAMLPGRSSRQWDGDEEEIVKMLKARRLKKDQIYPPKLITPAQIDKCDALTDEQKRKIQEKYVKVVPGKLMLKKVERSGMSNAEKGLAQFKELPVTAPSFF